MCLPEGNATLGNCSNTCRRDTAPTHRHKKRAAHAFTLIEVMFAIYILLIMALMFSAVSVSATRSSRFGNSYNQAMSLAQHKIDQLQDEGFDKALTPTVLYGKELDDPAVNYATGNSPAPTVYGVLPATNSYFKGYFTSVDKLNQYFVTQKSGTQYTPNSAQGYIEITPYPKTPVPAIVYNLSVKITITWQDAGYAKSTYTTEAVLTRTSNLNESN